MPAFLTRPALHFVVLGAVLFALAGARHVPTPAPAPEPIVIGAAQLGAMRTDFRRLTGRAPTADEETALVARAADEELLYREALARGLDRGDRSVRYRLVEKMRFLADDPERDPEELYAEALRLGLDRDDAVVRRVLVQKMRLLAETEGGLDTPSDAELEAYLARHRDRWTQPARVTLVHVFLSPARHGDALGRDADALLRRLRSAAMPTDEAIAAGDPFPFGHRVRAGSRHDLAKRFGQAFADAAMALAPGTWSGPLASPYGLHLVRIEAVEPPRLPALAAVRSQVLHALRTERRRERFAATLARLRATHAVRVERPEGGTEAGA